MSGAIPTRTVTWHKMESSRAWVERALGSRVRAFEPLEAGAGARRYWRVHTRDPGNGAVLMHAVPEDPEILPPGLRASAGEIPFVVVTEFLTRHALPVPRILAVDRERRLVLEEDLGDTRLVDLAAAEQTRLRPAVIDLLVRAHAIPERELPFPRVFDEEWIRFELGIFAEHAAPEPLRKRLVPALADLARAIAGLPKQPALRDVQSQNLMLDPQGKLRLLDYQDLLLAPPELDLAAFLYDSYVRIPPAERTALLERYAAGRGRPLDPEALRLLVVQRKCKDYAIFRRMLRVKKDLRFRAPERAAREAVCSVLAELPAELAHVAVVLREVFETEHA